MIDYIPRSKVIAFDGVRFELTVERNDYGTFAQVRASHLLSEGQKGPSEHVSMIVPDA